MMISVHLFARARDLAGRDVLPVALPEEASVAELRSAIAKACPALEALLGHSRIAVGNDFATDETKLQENAAVAIIPPVSGG